MKKLIALLLLPCLLCLPWLTHAAPAKPNIIFILADDLGLDGVSCYGADKHQTPQIDRLATSGTRFEMRCAAPLFKGGHVARTHAFGEIEN